MIYEWKRQPRGGLDAQVAGEYLEMLRDTSGGALTPESVLADAENDASPLHPAFEWDDSKAAAAHRLDQARYILRQIVVTFEERPDDDPIRAFVVVREAEDDDDAVFTHIAVALSDDAKRAQLIARAKREIMAWRHRHKQLVELAEIFTAVDNLFAVGDEGDQQAAH